MEESGRSRGKTLFLFPEDSFPLRKGTKTMAKAIFVGEFRSRLDEKGRMVFPSDFKAQLTLLEHKSLVVKKNLYHKSLSLYTLEAWEKESEKMKESLNLYNKEDAEIWNEFMRNRAIVTPDEKTGRILIPRHLLEKIEAIKEMVFVGADDSISLWAAEIYDNTYMSDEEYAALVAKRLGNSKSS